MRFTPAQRFCEESNERLKTFSHKRPIRNEAGELLEMRLAPVSRVTVSKLGHNHGTDKNKPLVVTLLDGDIIGFKPARASTARTKTARAIDVYEWIIRSEAVNAQMKRLRERKERKHIRLAAQRQERAEKNLYRKDSQ